MEEKWRQRLTCTCVGTARKGEGGGGGGGVLPEKLGGCVRPAS